jgi:hypothetical protein
MTKTNDATRKRPTHFEQIPLQVVKKIAEESVPNNKNIETDNVSVEPTATKGNPRVSR